MRGLHLRLSDDIFEREPTTVFYCGHIAGLYSLVHQVEQKSIEWIYWILVEPSGRGCDSAPFLPVPQHAGYLSH